MNAPAQNLIREAEASILRSKLDGARAQLHMARIIRAHAEDKCREHVNTINAIKQEALECGLSLNPPA